LTAHCLSFARFELHNQALKGSFIRGFPPQADQQTVQQSGFMKPAFKFVWERFPTAIKIDRIPLFDVRRSLVFSNDQTDRYFGRWLG